MADNPHRSSGTPRNDARPSHVRSDSRVSNGRTLQSDSRMRQSDSRPSRSDDRTSRSDGRRSARPHSRSDSKKRNLNPLFAILGIIVGLAIGGFAIVNIFDRISRSGGIFHLEDIIQIREPEIAEVDVLMIGDILMHRGVWESGQHADGTYDYTHFFAHIADELDACDLCMLDQETVLGGTELGISGYPMFNSPQQVGDSEVAVGFNCILQASNHSMDMGNEGLRRCVSFWRTNHPDVMLCGVVMPDEQRASDLGPQYFEKDGIRIAVLNYTEMLNGIPDPSDAVAELDEAQLQHDIAIAEANADITIVCPHWGDEDSNWPADRQRALAAKMCDWGVDVIFGNHPHVIQPVEVITNEAGHEMVVFWSVGNFVSTQIPARNCVGGIARVHIIREGRGTAHVDTYSFTPTVTHRGFGTNMTCYKLSDYNDDMVADNWWHGGEEKPTPQWARSYCREILGEAFNEETCRLDGVVYVNGVPGPSATLTVNSGVGASATDPDAANPEDGGGSENADGSENGANPEEQPAPEGEGSEELDAAA